MVNECTSYFHTSISREGDSSSLIVLGVISVRVIKRWITLSFYWQLGDTLHTNTTTLSAARLLLTAYSQREELGGGIDHAMKRHLLGKDAFYWIRKDYDHALKLWEED